MRYILFFFVIFGSPPFHQAFAQTQTALESARSLDACGGKKIIRARWKNDGSLKVVCDRKRRAANETPANITAGATNVVGLLIPALSVGAAVAAAAGASSSPSSTSSTGSN